MPTLQSLPLEVLEPIASNLDQRDLSAFVRSNRRFYLLLNYYLYRYNKEHFGGSALLWGARQGEIKTVQYSMQQGADLEIRDEERGTPLEIAVSQGHYAMTRLLIENGAKTHASHDDLVSRPLRTALEKCCRNMIIHREETSQNKLAWEPLRAATQMVHEELVDLVTRKDQFYSPIWSTLVEAVRVCETNIAIIRLLLEKGAEKTSNKRILLHTAHLKSCDATIKLLFEKESFSKINSSVRADGLSGAAFYGQIPMMNLFLEHGSDPNSTDWSTGWTPLMRAAYSGRLEAVKLLLEKGADPNLKSFDNETAILLARKGVPWIQQHQEWWYEWFVDKKGRKNVVKYLRRQGVKK